MDEIRGEEMNLEYHYRNLLKDDYHSEMYAHRNENGMERLEDHLRKTYEYAKEIEPDLEGFLFPIFGDDIEIARHLINSMYYLHDIGKATPYFLQNKMNIHAGVKNKKDNLAHHSELSACYYLDEMQHYLKEQNNYSLVLNNLVILLTMCIAKHHGNLKDVLPWSEDLDKYAMIMKQTENYLNKSGEKTVTAYFKKQPLIFRNRRFLNQQVAQCLNNVEKETQKKLCTLLPIIFSVLVSADFLATKNKMQNFNYLLDDYNECTLQQIYRTYNESFLAKSVQKHELGCWKTINDVRCEYILDVEHHLAKIPENQLFFCLEGMVGIGKTHASQRVALHFLHNGTKRVFWGVPYLSIASQTSKQLKMLDIEAVQLDSSEPIREEFDLFKTCFSKMVVNDRLMNYRNATITFVRFFNLLFSNSKSDALKRLSLKNSLIILDELQAIDVLLLRNFSEQIQKMAEILNFKVLFMSATMPIFEESYALSNAEKFRTIDLLTYRNELNFRFFNGKLSHEEVLGELNVRNKRVLVQCVTKKHASHVYQAIKDKYPEVEIYTGDTVLSERSRIVERLQRKESDGSYSCQEMILVTTNAVEAGVDISMNLAIVDLTMMDSLEQLSGRINRNREFKVEGSQIYVINYENAHFLSPIKVSVTNRMKPSEMESIFKNKNYAGYMQEIQDRAKKEKENYDIEKYYSELSFSKINDAMRLITEDSCQYYLINDKKSYQLMKDYKRYDQGLKNGENFDENYIQRKNTLIRLAEYRNEVRGKMEKEAFISEYGDNHVIFLQKIWEYKK
ncbi:MAG: CRISPR-associated endonuclease Cas3'' [Enterococcus sp.]